MTVERTRHIDLDKILNDIKHRELQIGFFETSHYPDGTPVAYVAAQNEFGNGAIPPRPFMRPAIQDNKKEWANQIGKGINAVIRGAIDLDSALGQAGLIAKADVEKSIEKVISPPLADSTLHARRTRKNKNKNQSDKPLIDTALMRDSVQFNVEKT